MYQFQSTHPARGGTQCVAMQHCTMNISIHPPRTGWDLRLCPSACRPIISIHPPRTGWDDRRWPCCVSPRWISIHPPRTGWDRKQMGDRQAQAGFQSTHPARGGTPGIPALRRARDISIHPPRTGWDFFLGIQYFVFIYFNPPTPHGVGHAQRYIRPVSRSHFNPPTPHGVGPRGHRAAGRRTHFNPPTPHGVGRRVAGDRLVEKSFQSTHPARGGT